MNICPDQHRPVPAHRPSAACTAEDSIFADEVWAKVGEQICLKCHHIDGDAADSEFLLRTTVSNRGALRHNLAAFLKVARVKKDGKSLLLLKATGGLDPFWAEEGVGRHEGAA